MSGLVINLWRVNDEVAKGEAEAIVLSLDPNLMGRENVSIPKCLPQKLSHFTLSVLEAKLNADTGNPTYIRIMSVLDLKGGLVR